MAPRTLDNCRYIKEYGNPGKESGYCRGLGKTYTDDEPAERKGENLKCHIG